MLWELRKASERFRSEEELGPVAYKPKHVTWAITLEPPGRARVTGPHKRGETRGIFAPDRQRSGQLPPPFLLADKASYVLGVTARERRDAADRGHRAFLALLEKAATVTDDHELGQILAFLRDLSWEDMVARLPGVMPDDLVAIRADDEVFPFEREPIQRFWAGYLEDDLATPYSATCSVCGREERVVRILPRELVIMGQKCQISSFNLPAFRSFGKEQTTNAPICFTCASDIIDTLDYLTRSEQHTAIIARDTSRSTAKNPLRNQLAVFWLEHPIDTDAEIPERLNLEVVLGAPLLPLPSAGPPPALGQLEAFLNVPWSAREASLRVASQHFYLAVLSANKGRLVVRDWIAAPVVHLRERLLLFLACSRVVGSQGQPARPLPIPALVGAVEATNPDLTRGLVRTAYLGYPPPRDLLDGALRRFRIAITQGQKRAQRRGEPVDDLWPLASALKLVLTFGKEEDAVSLEGLDPRRRSAAYLTGRLLAVLEEIQQRSAGWRLNSTVAERFYGAVSTTPAIHIGGLIRQARVAHLPKIRRDRGSADHLEALLEEILSGIDEDGGFPPPMPPTKQAEFALGFYHQRAAFRADRAAHRQASSPPEGGQQ